MCTDLHVHPSPRCQRVITSVEEPWHSELLQAKEAHELSQIAPKGLAEKPPKSEQIEAIVRQCFQPFLQRGVYLPALSGLPLQYLVAGTSASYNDRSLLDANGRSNDWWKRSTKPPQRCRWQQCVRRWKWSHRVRHEKHLPLWKEPSVASHRSRQTNYLSWHLNALGTRYQHWSPGFLAMTRAAIQKNNRIPSTWWKVLEPGLRNVYVIYDPFCLFSMFMLHKYIS